MSDYLGFTLTALAAVFFVVDPLAVIPAFLALTHNETPAERRRTALRASITSGLTLAIFAGAGRYIFRLFGVTLPAFQISGGILLFLLALDMMKAKPLNTKQTPEEEREGIDKTDVAIIPLAIPLLSGPGAIASVMVLMAQHPHKWGYAVPVYGAILVTAAATYTLLRGAGYLHRHISRTALNVMTRVMGLILAAVAVEFVLGGLQRAWPLMTGGR